MLLMAIILDLSINPVQGWQQPSSCLSVQSIDSGKIVPGKVPEATSAFTGQMIA